MKTDLDIKRISTYMSGRRMNIWVDKMCFEPFNWKIYKDSVYRMKRLILVFKGDYDRLSKICDKLTYLYMEEENE